jgi:hypothetical protein
VQFALKFTYESADVLDRLSASTAEATEYVTLYKRHPKKKKKNRKGRCSRLYFTVFTPLKLSLFPSLSISHTLTTLFGASSFLSHHSPPPPPSPLLRYGSCPAAQVS